MNKMRRYALCCCMVAPLACAPAGDRAATTDTVATTTAAGATATPAAITLADVAGKWNMRATPTSGTDTSVTLYVLTATPDASGWTITFPNRPPVPVRVTTGGDSIIMEAGPYQSVRRKGLQVRTHNVVRLEGGKLVGTTVARYATTGPDTVLRLRTEGTKAP